MKLEQQVQAPEGVEQTPISETRELGIDTRYTVVDDYEPTGGLHRLTDALVNMVYPRNENRDDPEGVINNSNRWVVEQRPDGSGILKSGAGGTIYGIRTAGGAILGNSRESIWFPYKSDYYEEPVDGRPAGQRYDYDWFIEVPYRFVGSVLEGLTSLDMHGEDSILALGREPENTVDGGMFMEGVVHADILDHEDERGVLLDHTSGVQVYVGWDSTAHRGEEMFGFVPYDGEDGIPAPSAEDALSLLRPNRAAAADERSDVVRQGEWFLVPTRNDADGTVQKPGVSSRPYGGSPLDSHVPRDWRTVVADETFVSKFDGYARYEAPVTTDWTPQDVLDYVHENLPEDAEAREQVFEDLREMAGGVQVRGTVRHRDNDHEIVQTDDWCEATTHDWDVMTVEDSSTTWGAMRD